MFHGDLALKIQLKQRIFSQKLQHVHSWFLFVLSSCLGVTEDKG